MAEFDGGLKVRVFGAGVAEPIQNAQVRIYNTENTELYSTFTDEAGETEIFVLPAPDPAFSENGGEQPYAVYNAEINADGYIPLRIEGVQVFPDVISIQPAAMTRGSAEERIIIIDAPALWGDYPEKIPEDEVKDIPDDSGFVVLDRVVVPEFVVPRFRAVVINCYNLLKRDVYRVFWKITVTIEKPKLL